MLFRGEQEFMLKKKKWFKEFRKILYELGCDEFTVEAFMSGARINKEFAALTPTEAVNEYVDIETERRE